jgi:predicted 3-demethylubiquinone-9 3-methyltransferase (glyoxalase superfamily)
MAKNTIFLWYDKDAEAAARFYAETFPDSAVGAIHRAPGDYPGGKKGDVITVEFKVAGVSCVGLNGGRTRPGHPDHPGTTLPLESRSPEQVRR